MSSAPVALSRKEIEREVNSVPLWGHSIEIDGEASRRDLYRVHRIGRWIIRNQLSL